jgi:glycosyltransferase involved in cell wall biosynthesis
VERLEKQVANAQSMAARAYEAIQQWPEKLQRLRADPDYELAYTDPEPLVSVRIATYNRVDTLFERALPSVLRQTYANWELIVVGDACTDDTEARVRAVEDARVRFVNLPFRGPYPDDPRARWHVVGYNAMNAGLRMATGRWIAAIDDDDEFDPDHLTTLLDHARTTRAELAYGQLRVVTAETHEPVDHRLCTWPPKGGGFNFLASLMHAGLRQFEYDYNCQFAGEAGDANLVRRMWEAGVRFSYLDRAVGTYYYAPRRWP